MLENWRSLPTERNESGLVLNDAPPLTVADVLPGGAAQRAASGAGSKVVAINGRASADLRRVRRSAVRSESGRDERADDAPRRPARPPSSCAAIRGGGSAPGSCPDRSACCGFDGSPSREERPSSGQRSSRSRRRARRGWIVDVRWCGGGFSIGLSRLLVDRPAVLAPAPQRRRIPHTDDARGHRRGRSALPFQRPLVVLTGPGSISGAESSPGRSRRRPRAAGGGADRWLCGDRPRLRPGARLAMCVTTRERSSAAEERRYNRCVGCRRTSGCRPPRRRDRRARPAAGDGACRACARSPRRVGSGPAFRGGGELDGPVIGSQRVPVDAL